MASHGERRERVFALGDKLPVTEMASSQSEGSFVFREPECRQGALSDAVCLS